jgi:hypothetical protein
VPLITEATRLRLGTPKVAESREERVVARR